jgi:hypothetical protein
VVAGGRTLRASSQLTGVDQNSCTVRLLAARQCAFSAAANEFRISCLAMTASFPSSLESDCRSVTEFRKNLLSISDVAHSNRGRPPGL